MSLRTLRLRLSSCYYSSATRGFYGFLGHFLSGFLPVSGLWWSCYGRLRWLRTSFLNPIQEPSVGPANTHQSSMHFPCTCNCYIPTCALIADASYPRVSLRNPSYHTSSCYKYQVSVSSDFISFSSRLLFIFCRKNLILDE